MDRKRTRVNMKQMRWIINSPSFSTGLLFTTCVPTTIQRSTKERKRHNNKQVSEQQTICRFEERYKYGAESVVCWKVLVHTFMRKTRSKKFTKQRKGNGGIDCCKVEWNGQKFGGRKFSASWSELCTPDINQQTQQEKHTKNKRYKK